ncbi:forkhead box protein H1-like [Syngnathoides biaculeatus]|uniref:forkhead box protein H1-like n=1 Tax=Syngnathoides biaculeatus TaxID=300417 RepID=UPI002ADDDD64|nr:forkhead box protein H1-like [Syngnathoides biaculeatus]XP_061679999.1 forkhead box protein H1-like [Syngnathoides biaculeatus]XP_061680000.1 forkhead box protein H1-like [Syngnathoides biaculeatus]XP_061680001.1 forkhead box protein H1-like [Syngnathoides biaculeatus]XP_061680003.1 forkhead box protein H1-like [Syngnathoides biaculeatus]XP_061680007.1 forkhead box protein H1-like [Syngnathoides biaculeatus]
MQNVQAGIPPGVCWEVYRRTPTYLARVAVVLQDAPDKMLTFMQLMERLDPLVTEDRRSVENNIRVCLSTHDCFIKVRSGPGALGGRRNFWKLDLSHVTPKMVRRHFHDILDFFPELRDRSQGGGEKAAPAVHVRCKVKFSGPFSIESLLKRDSPAPGGTAERRGRKRNLPWRSEDGGPPSAPPAALPWPAGGAVGERFCAAAPPFPTYAGDPFRQAFVPYRTHVSHFCL